MRWRDFAGFKLFGLITLYHITHHITLQACGISRRAFTHKKTEKERDRDRHRERDIEGERQRERGIERQREKKDNIE